MKTLGHSDINFQDDLTPCSSVGGEKLQAPDLPPMTAARPPETMFPRLLANDEWSRLYSRPHWFDLCDRDPIKMAIKSTQPLHR